MILSLNRNVQNINIEDSLSKISQQRREKILKLRNIDDRKRSLAAYLLLQDTLFEYFNVSEPPIFEFSDNGKPSLRDYPEIYFSMSHAGNYAICAVDESPVGVDIEISRKINSEMIRFAMDDIEQNVIFSSHNRNLEFLKLWTRKEAVLKLSGKGITSELRTVLENESQYEINTHSDDFFVYSVAKYAKTHTF